YGKPPPGSATEERWAKGKQWVEEQIAQMLQVIRDMGNLEADGTVTVLFGKLFYTYADISDSLVGILMRAKKRKLLYYDGDMLFQSKDDHVVITLPKA
ncbi:costars-domain-containing protein, partial [Pelagophyceae sp. CCMP2097]